MLEREYLGSIVICGEKVGKFSEKLFMETRRVKRATMKKEIKAFCRYHKISMGSLRRSCNGKSTLRKMYELTL